MDFEFLGFVGFVVSGNSASNDYGIWIFLAWGIVGLRSGQEWSGKDRAGGLFGRCFNAFNGPKRSTLHATSIF